MKLVLKFGSLMCLCVMISATVHAALPAPAQLTVEKTVGWAVNNTLTTNYMTMQADLYQLTRQPRPIGSDGEQAAAAYLSNRFRTLGYTVTTQPYTNEAGLTGTNVIAVKNTDGDADILVISAHHDSAPTSFGANDNASGVVALLAIAERLKDIPTDTELRFISFTDEENGKNGSRHYTAELTASERQRMIGNIQLDMLGGLGSSGLTLGTTDGCSNWLTGLLSDKNTLLPIFAETASDHTSFQLIGIPSVLVMQDGRGYLYHSAADTATQIDLHAVGRAVSIVYGAAATICSPETATYRPIARVQGDGYTYVQTRQSVIYFGSSLAQTEARIGAAGQLVKQKNVQGSGWVDSYDTYRYQMRWFNGKSAMETDYIYRNGFLERIEIHPSTGGYTTAQIQTLIEVMYGPGKSGEDRNGVSFQSWTDEIYSKYLTLSGTGQGCKVSIGNYTVGITNVLSSYPVQNGQSSISDVHDQAVWNYLCSILPQDARKRIGQFNLFTDGYSNVLAYASPMRGSDGTVDNTSFSISIDYYDAFDENGKPRDWSKLTYTILHEYGHALLEDSTQIDLSVGKDAHDPAGFRDGSFRKAYYDRFWKGLGDSAVEDYSKNPTHYVSRYGANYFHEDIADTFAVFVLGPKPPETTIAQQKLRMFWGEPDFVTLRQEIRTNLGLSAG